MIGLSMSFCVRDIATGSVPEDGVDLIIASTKAEDDDQWAGVFAQQYTASVEEVEEPSSLEKLGAADAPEEVR